MSRFSIVRSFHARVVASAALAVAVGAVVACGNASSSTSAPASIDLASYSARCSQDSDCVSAYSGQVSCTPCLCPNGAIAQSAETQYESDLKNAQNAACGGQDPALNERCNCVASPTAKCQMGTCVQPSTFEPADSGVDSGDAG